MMRRMTSSGGVASAESADILAMLEAGRPAAEVARVFRDHRATVGRIGVVRRVSATAPDCLVQHPRRLTPLIAMRGFNEGPVAAWPPT